MDAARRREWDREASRVLEGWDFSHLDGRWAEADPPWSYDELVRDALPATDSVLDIGTGGGERLARFTGDLPPRVVATETEWGSLRVAAARLSPHGVAVIRCRDALDQQLPFLGGSFGLVVNRHASFAGAEIHRVLRSGGAFLTQQVEGGNLADLAAEFGREPPYLFWTLEFARRRIEEAGLRIRRSEVWTGETEFLDVGALVSYLTVVPWTAPGFTVAGDLDHLERLQERLDRGGRLVYRQRRFLVIATKP